MSDRSIDKVIFLFDGVCDLCSRAVQFTIKHDHQKNILMAALQSEAGQKLLEKYGLPKNDFDSFVWIENEKAHTKSSGALRYFRRLSGAWPMLFIFIVIPKPLRDIIYDWVARNRYKWFGKRDSCLIPAPDIKSRFL